MRQAARTNARVTPGTAVASGIGVIIQCSIAGTISLKLAGGTTLALTVPAGITQIMDIAVQDVTAGTATATVDVLGL